MTSDLLTVLRELRREGRAPAALVGFSLGGNVVLKLAGEMGEDAADLVRCVTGVSTPLDLGACSRRIAALDNRIYEERFVRRMRERLCATGRYRPEDFAGLRTVEALDDRITAPAFGFGDAANYYRTQSAIGFLGRIRVPTLLIQSKDDTFIPFSIYDSPAIRNNPRIRLVATQHGGHLGFLARSPHRLWLDHAVMNFICETLVKNHDFESSEV
jgi:predicted alpha/beta-fold hydrolase